MTIDELIADLQRQKKRFRGDLKVATFSGPRLVEVAGTATIRKALWDGESSHDAFVILERATAWN